MIVYISKSDEAGKRLEQVVKPRTRQGKVELIKTFKDLVVRLGHPSWFGDLALLFAATPKDLNRLVTHRHLFNGLRLILIVPNQQKETVAKGHLLRPRFISTRDSDFLDVSMVMEKMETKT